MKHKLLKTLVVSLGLVSTAAVITNTEPSQTVEASKSNDIFWQGFETKKAKKYFKRWRKVVLTDECNFTQDVSDDFHQLPFDNDAYFDLPPLHSDISHILIFHLKLGA